MHVYRGYAPVQYGTRQTQWIQAWLGDVYDYM